VSLAGLVLVAVAALAHATWNLLTKGSRDKVVFLWWTGAAGTVLFLPAVLLAGPAWPGSPEAWLGVALGAALRAAYFAALGAAYARGDLSLVYPLARGTAPVLVPIAAVLVLGERVSPAGALGVAVVAAGVYVLHLPGLARRHLWASLRALAAPRAGYALLTGLLTTAYSVVDKWNMASGIPPLLYAYLTIPVAALLLTPVTLGRPATVAAEWRASRGAIAAVAALMTGGYVLVLTALRFTPVSYVAPARELGIVFGTVLGAVVLGEGHLRQRTAGACLIVLGVILITAAT
jgi:drug/metabolite transporter (DMT)-like permease